MLPHGISAKQALIPYEPPVVPYLNKMFSKVLPRKSTSVSNGRE